jgi:hypothetical protein
VILLVYVYCLVRSARAPALPPLSAAMPGAKDLRLLDAGGGLRIVVSSVRAAAYDEAALARGLQDLDWVGRRAIAHEHVVEHFLSSPAVLPMQLFSLFTSDERALAHVAGNGKRIDRIMAALERKHEWGLRLTFDERSARDGVERKHATASAGSGKSRATSSRSAGGAVKAKMAAGTASGTSYLARKRDLLDVTRVQLAGAKTAADSVYAVMSRAAAGAVRRRSTEQAAPGSRLLLDAAFLVPTRRTAGFRAELRRRARALPAGVVVSLTGPWPPYNFIDAPRSPPRR